MNPLIQSLYEIIIDCELKKYFDEFEEKPCIQKSFLELYKDKNEEKKFSG